MSRSWLIALILGMAGSACAQEAITPVDTLELFNRACIQSGGDRAEFKAVGEKLNWQSLPLLERPDSPDWGVGYGSPTGRLMMMGRDRPLQITEGGYHPRTLTFPAQVSCALEVATASESDQLRVVEFAQANSFAREPDRDREAPPEDALPGEEFTYWNGPDDRSITIRHLPPNGRLTVEITYLKPGP